MWLNSIDFFFFTLQPFLISILQFCLAIVTKGKKSMMKGINPFEMKHLLSFSIDVEDLKREKGNIAVLYNFSNNCHGMTCQVYYEYY